ncbi:MAG: hypothetical protein ACR2J3_02910 [Aridibacter sp.]
MLHFSTKKETTESNSTETEILLGQKIVIGAKKNLRAVESLAKVRKLLAEAELKEQQTRNKRSKNTAIADKFLNDSAN